MSPFITAILAASCFAVWPMIARFSGLSSAWVAVIAMSSTLLVAVGAIGTNPGPLSMKGFVLVLLAGVLNGTGIVLFSSLFAGAKGDPSRYVSITYGLLPALSMVGMIIWFHDPMTIPKVLGLGLVVAGVFLILK